MARAWDQIAQDAPWWAQRDLPRAPWVERFREACLGAAPHMPKLKRMWAPWTRDWADIRFVRRVEDHLPQLRLLKTSRRHSKIRDLLLTLAVDASLLPEEMRPTTRAVSPGRPRLIGDAHLRELARQTRTLITLLRAASATDVEDCFPMLTEDEITEFRRPRHTARAVRRSVIPLKISPATWLLANRGLGRASTLQRCLDGRARTL